MKNNRGVPIRQLGTVRDPRMFQNERPVTDDLR